MNVCHNRTTSNLPYHVVRVDHRWIGAYRAATGFAYRAGGGDHHRPWPQYLPPKSPPPHRGMMSGKSSCRCTHQHARPRDRNHDHNRIPGIVTVIVTAAWDCNRDRNRGRAGGGGLRRRAPPLHFNCTRLVKRGKDVLGFSGRHWNCVWDSLRVPGKILGCERCRTLVLGDSRALKGCSKSGGMLRGGGTHRPTQSHRDEMLHSPSSGGVGLLDPCGRQMAPMGRWTPQTMPGLCYSVGVHGVMHHHTTPCTTTPHEV